MKKYLVMALLLYGARTDQSELKEKLIVWDVGQGQWVTLVNSKACFHYDMGGEVFPRAVLELCRKKVNHISLSHWDYDHTSFVFQFQKQTTSVCISHLPIGKHFLKEKMRSWKICPNSENEKVITPIKISKKENENSSVFLIKKGRALITGDAPKKRERKLFSIGKVEVLVVGHHGSTTSSSIEFLSRLKKLKVGLVSARQSKYGHPHQEVVSKFKKLKVPLMSTSDWGTIVYIGL